MLNISCLSQKGGVGKSTLARMIATTYAGAGWRVKIADFNVKQKTSTDWAALRMGSGIEPSVPAEAFREFKNAKLQSRQYDLMVFDGRPDSDVSTIEIAKESQLVIIPVSVTNDDLQPQVRFAHELLSRGVARESMLFVVNQSLDSVLSVEDAKSFVRAAGYAIANVDIPNKTGYQIAQNIGRAITETAYPTLNKRAETAAQEIVTRVNEIP